MAEIITLRHRGVTYEVPNRGIKAGEKIGYRGWLLHGTNMNLRSVAMSYFWYYDTPAEGNPLKQPEGIYAFKTKKYGRRQLLCEVVPSMVSAFQTLIIGTVYMWGTIIEHQYGYRAEFARIRSLDEIFGYREKESAERTLQRLRSLYGV